MKTKNSKSWLIEKIVALASWSLLISVVSLALFVFLKPESSVAHTNGVGWFRGAGCGEMTFYFGTYHSGGADNYSEGEINIRNASLTYNETLEFTASTQTEPAVLDKVNGTNYKTTNHVGTGAGYQGGRSLIAYATGPAWSSKQVMSTWQSAQVSGLAPGSYTFTYIPLNATSGDPKLTSKYGNLPRPADPNGNRTPTAVWDPLNDAVDSAAPFTLTKADLGFPDLTGTVPADNATGVNILDKQIVFTFSEAMTLGSGNIVIKNAADDSTVETIPVNSPQVSGNGTDTITATWTTHLAPSANYYVNVEATAFVDACGYAHDGLTTSKTAMNFATSGSPVLVSSSPADDANSVAPNAQAIVLNFSEEILLGSGKVTIRQTSDDVTVETINVADGQVVGAGTSTITVKWGPWIRPDTDYYVLIDVTAFKDDEDNPYVGITDKTTLNFKTAPKMPNPFLDPDVAGLVEAQANLALRVMERSLSPVLDRVEWFRRNNRGPNLSKQGIMFTFANREIDRLVNNIRQIRNGQTQFVNNVLYSAVTAMEKIGYRVATTDKTQEWLPDSQCTPEELQLINENKKLVAKLAEGEDILMSAVDTDIVPTTEGDLFGNGWAVWTAGNVTVGRIESTSTASLKEFKVEGIAIGIDRKMDDDTLLGIAVTIGDEETDVGTAGTNLQSDDYGVALYGLWSINEESYFNSVVGYNKLDINMLRKHPNGDIRGSRIGHQIFQSTTVQKEFDHEAWHLVPYARFDFGYTFLRPYEETGNFARLIFDKQRVKIAKSRFGVRADRRFKTSFGAVIPNGFFEHSTDMGTSSNATALYPVAPDMSYSYKLSDLRSTDWRIGVGVGITLKSGGYIGFNLERTEETEHGNNRRGDVTSILLRANVPF